MGNDFYGGEELDREAEEELILRCQKGDKKAFGWFVRRYMQRAYSVALGLTSSHEAALDLSQDAFVRAFRAIKRFKIGKSFFTWYYQILRNLCFNYLRNHARQARPFSEIGEGQILTISDGEQSVAEALEQAELRELVWQAIHSLKKNEREILILREFEELSYKEISEILNISIGTVMSRLFNARKSLKAKLESHINA